MERQQIEVDGINMHWVEKGRGHPVVLIHGLGTSAELWRHVLPRVDEGHLLAWDMVGYGASIGAGRDRDISIRRQVDYLLKWMDQMELESAILVGHDIGGGVAQIAAVRHPDRVDGLVLANAVCYDSWPVRTVKIMQRLNAVTARMPDALFRALMKILLRRGHETREGAREGFDTHVPFYLEAGGAAALARQVRSLDTADTLAIADDLPDLALPAELVWGAADQFQTIDYGERLADDLDAPLDRIEGGKHFAVEDHPDRVAAAISRMVEAVSAEVPRRPTR